MWRIFMRNWSGFIGLFILGILLMWKPRVVWNIQHFLSVKDGEPTEFYLIVTRVSGIIFLIIGVIWMFRFII